MQITREEDESDRRYTSILLCLLCTQMDHANDFKGKYIWFGSVKYDLWVCAVYFGHQNHCCVCFFLYWSLKYWGLLFSCLVTFLSSDTTKFNDEYKLHDLINWFIVGFGQSVGDGWQKLRRWTGIVISPLKIYSGHPHSCATRMMQFSPYQEGLWSSTHTICMQPNLRPCGRYVYNSTFPRQMLRQPSQFTGWHTAHVSSSSIHSCLSLEAVQHVSARDGHRK